MGKWTGRAGSTVEYGGVRFSIQFCLRIESGEAFRTHMTRIAPPLYAGGRGWLTTLFSEAGMEPPTVGLAGFLASTGWINVIAYAVVALILIAATRGRLGYRP